jgi:TetR/AcrR family transcriptional repressor of mexJK operon
MKSASLQTTLTEIGYRFIQLLTDDNVISMYKVVIGESSQDSKVAELFYDAGPLHSIKLVTNLLMQHPDTKMSELQAHEISVDFFNLLKSDYHMRGILHLQYSMIAPQQLELAQKVSKKTMALIELIKED